MVKFHCISKVNAEKSLLLILHIQSYVHFSEPSHKVPNLKWDNRAQWIFPKSTDKRDEKSSTGIEIFKIGQPEKLTHGTVQTNIFVDGYSV